MNQNQDKITEEEAKLADIYKQTRDALQSQNQINLEKENVEKEIKVLLSKKEDLKLSIDALNLDLDSASVARSAKITEINKINEDISAAKAVLESTKNANDKAVRDGVNQVMQIGNEQSKIIIDAKQDLQIILDKKLSLEKEMAPIEDQVSRLISKISELTSNIETLTFSVSQLENKNSILSIKQSVLNDSISDLENKEKSVIESINEKSAISLNLDAEIVVKTESIESINKEIDALKEILKTNNEQNIEFLKAKAGLNDARQEVDQRLEFLKQKYGDLGESW